MHDLPAAWRLLTEYTASESLRKHARAVEACMAAYAEKFAAEGKIPADELPQWAITGLLHDFDYEKYPTAEEHPFVGNKILREQGWPEPILRAILSHANYSGVSRDSLMEKALFACDELSGLITAATLVKPTKNIDDLDAQSVRKKMKDKAFARSISRDDIIQGAQDLGVELIEHIAFCIAAMRGRAQELGLGGS